MTSETTSTQNEASGMPFDSPRPEHDFMLQQLAMFANAWKVSANVTLTIGGTMVSGQIISFEEWVDGLAAAFRDNFRGDSGLGQNFHDLISSYKGTTPATGDDTVPPLPRFIHLKDVRLYSASSSNSSVETPFWRGRISEVSGFNLGAPSKPV